MFTDFMGYRGRHVLKFPGGVSWVRGRDATTDPPGSNGAGKTSLFYAFTWCLQGRLPAKEFIADDVVFRDADSTTVTLELEGEETHLFVKRSRKVGKGSVLSYECNGVPFKGDQAATQLALDRLLGVDWALFNSVVLLKKRSPVANIYDSTPATRMKTVSTVIQDEVFQAAAKYIGKKVSAMGRELTMAEGELVVRNRSISELETELETLRQNMAKEANRVESLTFVVEQGNRGLETEILELHDRIRQGPGVDMTAVQQRLGRVSAEHSALLQEQGELRYRTKAAPELCQGKCPTCKQVVSPEYVRSIQQAVGDLNARLTWVTQQLEVKRQEVAEMQQAYQAVQNWPREVQVLQSRIDQLKLQAYANREGIDNKLLTQYGNQSLIIESRLESEVAARDAVAAKIGDLTSDITTHTTVQNAFSKDIRYMLIDELRHNMEFFANLDLARIGREGQRLRFESEGGEKETFNIYPEYDEARMPLPSDGQTYRFSLVCAIALLKAIRVTSPHRLGILMIDDPVGELDDNGCRDVGALFQSLAEDVPVVMVSSPRDVDFGTANVIQVTKTHLGSILR